MHQRLAYFGQVRTNALGALDALDRPEDKLSNQFLIDTYQASQMLARRLGRDTNDEVLPVGANDEIADVSVRNRLANFYRNIEAQAVAAILNLDIRPDLTRRIGDLDLKLWALQQMVDRVKLLDDFLRNAHQ